MKIDPQIRENQRAGLARPVSNNCKKAYSRYRSALIKRFDPTPP
jgi:hypothetical protein